MNKDETIKLLQSKIELGKEAVEMASIIFEKNWWIDTAKKAHGPINLTLNTGAFSQILTIHNVETFIEKYSDDSIRANSAINILKLSIADMISHMREIINKYCYKNEMSDKLSGKDWFFFATTLRNAYRHDYNFFDIKENKPASLKFSDRTITFDASRSRTPLTMDDFPISYAYELAEIMINAVKNDFK